MKRFVGWWYRFLGYKPLSEVVTVRIVIGEPSHVPGEVNTSLIVPRRLL